MWISSLLFIAPIFSILCFEVWLNKKVLYFLLGTFWFKRTFVLKYFNFKLRNMEVWVKTEDITTSHPSTINAVFFVCFLWCGPYPAFWPSPRPVALPF